MECISTLCICFEAVNSLIFPDPASVRQVCVELVQFPKVSHMLEASLTKCSRALNVLADLTDVLAKGNGTCSTRALKARYPLEAKHEGNFTTLRGSRFWRPYQKYLMLVSRWKIFAMLANHTRHCKGLGYACSLFNPWEPLKCFKHHQLIEAVLEQPCYHWPKFPPRAWRPKIAKDWLGIKNPCNVKGLHQDQLELTRRFECWGLPFGPLPGEDYFESISLVKSVLSSEEAFTVVEAGSDIGYWSLKAVHLWNRISPSRPCHLILIDSEADMAAASEHLKRNNIYQFCNVSLFHAFASADLLDRLLSYGQIDMLHVDIQKWEVPLVYHSKLLTRVRHLHIGTHYRRIHKIVKDRLLKLDFAIELDFSPLSLAQTQYGPVVFSDGVLAGHFPHKARLA